jgi:hypothetical protein
MEALLEHSPCRGGKIDRPPLRPVRCSSRVAADAETGNNSPFRPPPPPVQHLLLGGGGGVRRISSTTKKNQAQTKHLYRRLLRSCLPKRRSSVALVLIMSTSVGTVVCLLLLILVRPPRSTAAVVSQLAPPLLANTTTTKQLQAPMQSDRRMSVGLKEILSTVDYSNPRTRGLLEVLRAAHQNDDDDPVWPDYLTLHRGATLPDVDTTACIVTAYFRVKSKYTTAKYEDEWMGNLLSLQDCLVIFCEDALVPTMLQARRSKPTVVIAMRLDDLPIASYHYPSSSSSSSTSQQYGDTATAYWEHQLSIDPERRLHKSYQLFWIWLSKTWFVATAALLQQRLFFVELGDDNNDDESNKEGATTGTTTSIQTWMWADIGSFRNAQFSNVRLIQHPESLLDVHDNNNDDDHRRTVVWMAHHAPRPPKDPYWNKKLDPTEKIHYYHSGSHGLAVSVEAWVQYYIHFVTTLDEYGRRGLFVGEDQCVLQSTCLLHPESCAYLPYNRIDDHRYFGLRSALRYGHKGQDGKKRFELWRPPPLLTTMTTVPA